MNIGDRVQFILADDIEAIIIGRSESANAGKEYQVAWISEGNRMMAWVTECEIKESNYA